MRNAIFALACIGFLAVGLTLGITQSDKIKAYFASPSGGYGAQSTDVALNSGVSAARDQQAVNAIIASNDNAAATENTTEAQVVAVNEDVAATDETPVVATAAQTGNMTPTDLSDTTLNDQSPAAGDETAATETTATVEETEETAATQEAPAPRTTDIVSPGGLTIPASNQPPKTEYVVNVAKSLENRSIGSPDAPLTVHDFSSLTCPHCARFHSELLPKIKENYIDKGTVRWVFHSFPLNEPAMKADMIARCAPGDQYLKLRDFMFKNQERWAFSAEQESVANLNMLLKLAGITDDVFQACAGNHELEVGLAEAAQNASQKYKIESTPSFVFNDGQKVFSGVGSYEGFAYDLDRALESLKGPRKPAEKPAEPQESTLTPPAPGTLAAKNLFEKK